MKHLALIFSLMLIGSAYAEEHQASADENAEASTEEITEESTSNDEKEVSASDPWGNDSVEDGGAADGNQDDGDPAPARTKQK